MLLHRIGRWVPAAAAVSAAIMKALPVVSMLAICVIIAIITSISRDDSRH